ncbi:TetR/AcrR family transcriptional regulator [Brevundimonas balnearis]|uniref:TetR/AcrR family transcriptional regulator n=1 Tax=Brevundimonas balnearis TaxID=1572858 RepID=A0ABV6R4R0_9CAUL
MLTRPATVGVEAAMGDTGERPVNKLGHRIGRRGGRTREALLAAARGLLETHKLADLRPADVARAAGVSAPSFYTYFKTVDEPVLALCEAAGAPYQGLAALFDADWSGERAFEQARAYVLAVVDIWAEHGPVLRIENALADEGHDAFARERIRRLRRVHLAIERRIAEARVNGRHDSRLDARLASYEAASMVDSVAAGLRLMQRGDTPLDDVVDTTALLFAKLVTGR